MVKFTLTRLRNPGSNPTNNRYRRLAVLTRNGLSIIGFTALTVLAVSVLRPELRAYVFYGSPMQAFLASGIESATAKGQLEDLSSLVPIQPSLGVKPSSHVEGLALNAKPAGFKKPIAEPMSLEQKRVAQYLTARYRIAQDAAQMLTQSAYEVARSYKLDPLLILAVAGIESSFNPLAASGMGAEGLMQVMTRIHGDKYESLAPSQRSAFNPLANMQVGAQILQDCIKRGGSVDNGLRLYVGAGNSGNDGGYPEKVMAERQRIQLASVGAKVTLPVASTATPANAASVGKPATKPADADTSYDKVVSFDDQSLETRLLGRLLGSPDKPFIASNP